MRKKAAYADPERESQKGLSPRHSFAFSTDSRRNVGTATSSVRLTGTSLRVGRPHAAGGRKGRERKSQDCHQASALAARRDGLREAKESNEGSSFFKGESPKTIEGLATKGFSCGETGNAIQARPAPTQARRKKARIGRGIPRVQPGANNP